MLKVLTTLSLYFETYNYYFVDSKSKHFTARDQINNKNGNVVWGNWNKKEKYN